ncbi:MAG: TIGR03067 domain-containing protein [Planctomycetaceae bacterium]|nr:TIGR03067 domain-containing protein [Planctomycetales bacterium]MCB9923268.1 TIGR03067 domain-containing protein [Planctomycetaceae bacterium]
MRSLLFALLAAIPVLASANDTDMKALQRDRKLIEGTWRVTSLEINGERSKEEDAAKLTVVNDNDGTWSVRSEGNEIGKGTSTFDATKKPKTIDFTPAEGGGKGQQFLGIYELGKNTRKLCFAPPGKDRPVEFSSTRENQCILVTFERMPK